MELTSQSAFEEELQQLKTTLTLVDDLKKRYESIPRYHGYELEEQALELQRTIMRQKLSIAAKEPYFGRLDFQESGAASPVPLYIGKVGIEDEAANQPIVIDWRAPIASLFYSFNGGDDPAVYLSPDGEVQGTVHLKRNLVVRERILQRVVDSYERGSGQVSAADEFLLYRLGESKDNKLRDIVATIQAEQDRIIRASKNTALIIQGVAGSGKTTVALHRLAFLLYQYRDVVQADRMIIFAPNRMFLDYISNVLPELGVGHIRQTTFQDWALDQLNCQVELVDPVIAMRERFSVVQPPNAVEDRAIERFKGSIAFHAYLKSYCDAAESRYAPQAGLEIWDECRLEAETIREWYEVEYKHEPCGRRHERIAARLERWTNIRLKEVKDSSLRSKLKRTAGQRLRAYLKRWPVPDPAEVYRSVFEEALKQNKPSPIPKKIAETTLASLSRGKIHLDDLAPLLYIQDRLYGMRGESAFDHTVIDEAQDFSPFQIELLRSRTRGGSFTILGDLSQGIHSYQGIEDWDEFLQLFEPGAAQYVQLEQSYRSTMEIIHFANSVLERGGDRFTPAVPVFRSGDPVVVESVPEADEARRTADAVREMRSAGAATVAVICRTDEDCRQAAQWLADAGIEATVLDAGQEEYLGGVSVIPVYWCKGLEFDSVLLLGVDEIRYQRNGRDAKLLYVGCTRALHRLRIMYTGQPSPLIQDIDSERSEKVKLNQ